jgi:DNA-binding GntR family transcriptional regulator
MRKVPLNDISGSDSRSDEQLARQAFKRLYADILSGVLPPGAQVTEVELMNRYELTRAPIRDAMVRLGHEGWVTPQARRGYIVKPITLRLVREAFDLRKQLEPEAARRAAGRVDQALLAELDAATQRPYDPTDRAKEDEFFTANVGLHTGIAMAAGNLRVARLVRGLLEESGRILRVGMRHANWSRGWQHGHGELLEALAAGNGELAARIALRQLEYSERVVMDALTERMGDLDLCGEDVPRST